MGLFTRRAHAGPVAPAPVTDTKTRHARGSWFSTRSNATANNTHTRRQPFVMDYTRRPPFGQWLRATWLDLLTMLCLGVIGLGVYAAPPAPSRSFPITFQDGEIVYPQFAYPVRKEIVPIWLAALLASLIPILVICFVQLRARSFWDMNNAIIGLLYSLINAGVFQVFLKWLIGGLRPHFLAVCAPDVSALPRGNGFQQIMFDRSVCTGNAKDINDALESFPSGHSTAAFAGFVFLFLYLNAKLKVFANYHPAFWKLVAVYSPLLAATLIAGSLTVDEFHNWYDCLAGATIGTIMALSSYRMVYAALWDFRFNHIPLNRGVPFTYVSGEGELEHALWTRKAGWGADVGALGGHQHHHHGFGGSSSANEAVGSNAGSGGVLGHHHDYPPRTATIDRKAVGSGGRVTGDAMV